MRKRETVEKIREIIIWRIYRAMETLVQTDTITFRVAVLTKISVGNFRAPILYHSFQNSNYSTGQI